MPTVYRPSQTVDAAEPDTADRNEAWPAGRHLVDLRHFLDQGDSVHSDQS